MTLKSVFGTSFALALMLAGCGGDDNSGPPPVGGAPTPSPTPTPTPTPTPSSFVASTNISYGAGPVVGGSIPLLLDLYRPQLACDAPRPTVIFVHGGGFVGGSRTGANVDVIASELTRRGINLISIDYRLQGDNPVTSSEFAAFEGDFRALNTAEPAERVTAFTAAVEDAVRAMRWADANAATYCIDPQRFGLWGSSAGAYTVLHAAYALDDYAIPRPPVRVVVDYWGGLFRDPDLEAGEPPLFVLHGTNDPTVAYTEATQITDRAQAIGVPFTFYTSVGGGHGFESTGFFDVLVDGESIAGKTANFVDAHMRTGGQPVYERRDFVP